jgi:hypothetical protein
MTRLQIVGDAIAVGADSVKRGQIDYDQPGPPPSWSWNSRRTRGVRSNQVGHDVGAKPGFASPRPGSITAMTFLGSVVDTVAIGSDCVPTGTSQMATP